MIKLKETLTTGSTMKRNLKLLKRNDTVALYEQSTLNGRVEGYQVFKIKVIKAGRSIGNKTYAEDTEVMPSASSFGRTAFFPITLEKAEEHFQTLSNRSTPEVADDEGEEGGTVENDDGTTPTEQPKAKVKTTYNFPDGEFTLKELVAFNNSPYPAMMLNLINRGIAAGTVKFLRLERRSKVGKVSKVYSKV